MTTLSIKDVPEDWAEALRQRAARNHRSLQGELTAILEAAVQAGADAQATPLGLAPTYTPGHTGIGHPALRGGRKTIEQIAQEHRLRFPEPIRGGPLAVDIIREDRDSR
jgi:plasmid stability protein